MSKPVLKASGSTVVSRFAPSPTGPLHLGHAFAAWSAYDPVRAGGGRFLLRIEDIDQARCRPEYEQMILDDLAWLGLRWEQPVRRQSEHFDDYRAALENLRQRGLTYPCFCTRKSIRAEIARAPSAPHGPDGALYPGTCRRLSPDQRAEKIAAGVAHAFRLDVNAALALLSSPLYWHDRRVGKIQARPEQLGDVVLARKETPASYHLSVIVDDALQGVNLVTRGKDLFHASHVHRLLQALLDLPVPEYNHHDLVLGADGVRLASRRGGQAIADYRAQGLGVADLMVLSGFSPAAI